MNVVFSTMHYIMDIKIFDYLAIKVKFIVNTTIISFLM